MRLELIAANKLYNQDVQFSGPLVTSVQIDRQGERVTSKAFFSFSNGGFDFKDSNNCTTCCNQKNNIFHFVTNLNKFYETQVNIMTDHVSISCTIPQAERIASLRVHWTNFPQCVFINKLTTLASPSDMFLVTG